MRARRPLRPIQTIAPFLLLILIAAGLRFYRLDAQSFWNDEGNSARLVERPIRLILAGAAADIHPPGYYLLLHLWRRLVGHSEFALRSLSTFCGVLTVALAARIGRSAGGRICGIGAGLLMATHPLAVYYSQEARMYALLGLIAALSLFAAMRWIALVYPLTSAPPVRGATKTGALALLGLSIAAGLYTHYAYGFALIGLNLAFAGYWLTRRPWQGSALVAWISAHLVAGLAFLPWAPLTLRALGWRPPDLATSGAWYNLFRTLANGVTLPEPAGRYAIFALLATVALAALARARDRFVQYAALGMALVPPALIASLGIYRPAYLKFLLVSLAPLAVALAIPLQQGTSRRQRWLTRSSRLLAGCLLLILAHSQAIALHHLYLDPRFARDDYRGIATRIAQQERPGDAIILNAPNQWEVFTYYYRGPAQVYPAPYHPQPELAAEWVQDIVRSHTRVFVLYWGDSESDPGRSIEREMALQAHKASDIWITQVRLALYGTPLPLQSLTELVSAQVGPEILLEGYALQQRPYYPGDIIPLTLFWRAQSTPDQRYKVFVHLLDAGGALVAQNDSEPQGGLSFTDGWSAGQSILDRHGILIPSDIPPGSYSLTVGMYTFDGARLPILVGGELYGDALHISEISVAAP